MSIYVCVREGRKDTQVMKQVLNLSTTCRYFLCMYLPLFSECDFPNKKLKSHVYSPVYISPELSLHVKCGEAQVHVSVGHTQRAHLYLVVVGFTVRQALPLVMAMSKEWLLTLSTNKMLKEWHEVIFASPCFIYVVEQSPRTKEKIHESRGAGVIWVTSDPAVLPALIQHPEAWTQQQNENRADM